MENQTLDPQNTEEKEGELIVETANDGVSLNQSKLILARKILSNLSENIRQLNNLLGIVLDPEQISRIGISQAIDEDNKHLGAGEHGEKIIEGVFDGEAMIGPDGKRYNVSANYASKSKLVEGDIMKLSITHSGTFVFKQIGPIERVRVIGALRRTGENDFVVVKDGKTWKVLTASVTYFKGDDGDECVILVPKNGESRWAAVENVIKQA